MEEYLNYNLPISSRLRPVIFKKHRNLLHKYIIIPHLLQINKKIETAQNNWLAQSP